MWTSKKRHNSTLKKKTLTSLSLFPAPPAPCRLLPGQVHAPAILRCDEAQNAAILGNMHELGLQQKSGNPELATERSQFLPNGTEARKLSPKAMKRDAGALRTARAAHAWSGRGAGLALGAAARRVRGPEPRGSAFALIASRRTVLGRSLRSLTFRLGISDP